MNCICLWHPSEQWSVQLPCPASLDTKPSASDAIFSHVYPENIPGMYSSTARKMEDRGGEVRERWVQRIRNARKWRMKSLCVEVWWSLGSRYGINWLLISHSISHISQCFQFEWSLRRPVHWLVKRIQQLISNGKCCDHLSAQIGPIPLPLFSPLWPPPQYKRQKSYTEQSSMVYLAIRNFQCDCGSFSIQTSLSFGILSGEINHLVIIYYYLSSDSGP